MNDLDANTIINIEKIRIKPNNINLTLVLGAGNINGGGFNDYDKFKNYTVCLTDNKNLIDFKREVPLGLLVNFNNNEAMHYLAKQLGDRFDKIIFDFSVVKFFHGTCINQLLKLLKPKGKLIIDQTVYGYMIAYDQKTFDIEKARFNNSCYNTFLVKVYNKTLSQDFFTHQRLIDNNIEFIKNSVKNMKLDITIHKDKYPLHEANKCESVDINDINYIVITKIP